MHDEKGFTLLEVLVALGIMLIGIIATMQMFPRSLLQARVAAERTVATSVVQSQFGLIRAGTATGLAADRIVNQDDKSVRDSVLWDDETNRFGYHTEVQLMPGGATSNLQRVTFVIEFVDDRTETFVTYVADQ